MIKLKASEKKALTYAFSLSSWKNVYCLLCKNLPQSLSRQLQAWIHIMYILSSHIMTSSFLLPLHPLACVCISVRQENFIYKCMSCLIQIKKVDSYNILHGWIKWAFFCVCRDGWEIFSIIPSSSSAECYKHKANKKYQGLTVGIKYCLTFV
jgi:hypothetical protein